MYLFNLLNVLVQAPAQVAQSVVSDFLTSPLTSGSPTLDANVILDNLITSIREDMKQRWDHFFQALTIDARNNII